LFRQIGHLLCCGALGPATPKCFHEITPPKLPYKLRSRIWSVGWSNAGWTRHVSDSQKDALERSGVQHPGWRVPAIQLPESVKHHDPN
jgi:hypothetical protein